MVDFIPVDEDDPYTLHIQMFFKMQMAPNGVCENAAVTPGVFLEETLAAALNNYICHESIKDTDLLDVTLPK